MEYISNNSMKQYVEEHHNLVSMKETSYPGIFVLKYKKNVFYNNLWDPHLEECRGTLVDADFNIVSLPFKKIYNYGIEKNAPILEPGTYVNAYRKVNGFMVAVTWYKDDILVSTTGSTDSDFVDMARELIEPNIEKFRKTCKEYDRFTFMFEAVHRDDPHIVPEMEGMYLLGMRPKVFGSSILIHSDLHENFGCYDVEHIRCTIDTLHLLTKQVKHEGFVFYTSDDTSAKIKSPYYLVGKFVARNPKTDKLLKADAKEKVEEEYYPLIDHIRDNIAEFTDLNEQQRLQFVRDFLEK